MTETMRTILVLFAMFLGLCCNFLLPYVRKLIVENRIDQIDLKYVVHLIIAACWEFLFGFAVYYQWQPPSGIVDEAMLYILAFAFGYGGSEFQKEVEKWFNSSRSQPTTVLLTADSSIEGTPSTTESIPTDTTTTSEESKPEPTTIKPEDITI